MVDVTVEVTDASRGAGLPALSEQMSLNVFDRALRKGRLCFAKRNLCQRPRDESNALGAHAVLFQGVGRLRRHQFCLSML